MTDQPDPTSPLKTKLIAKKQDWAREGRLLTGDVAPPEQRLPPGQRLVRDWPVLDLGVQPDISTEEFRLALDGAVKNPMSLDWPALMALPQAEMVADMHCVTQWSNYDNRWRGVKVAALLELVQPVPECRHVVLHAHDTYTANLTLYAFAADDAMLVHHWNGAPISRPHGGPLRAMLPRLYLWKSAKWLRRIEFRVDERRDSGKCGAITIMPTRGGRSAMAEARDLQKINSDGRKNRPPRPLIEKYRLKHII